MYYTVCLILWDTSPVEEILGTVYVFIFVELSVKKIPVTVRTALVEERRMDHCRLRHSEKALQRKCQFKPEGMADSLCLIS